jgi:hypothetical protein
LEHARQQVGGPRVAWQAGAQEQLCARDLQRCSEQGEAMTPERPVSVSRFEGRAARAGLGWLVLVCACVVSACGDDTNGAGSASAGRSAAAAVGGSGGAPSAARGGGAGSGAAGAAGSAADGGGAATGSGGAAGSGANACSAACDPGQHCELVMVECIRPPCPPAQPMCVDDPAPRGGTCGTRGAHACPDEQYCDYVRGKCGSDDSGGTCEDVPQICDDLAMPVCGCDGKTYSNACDAARQRVSVKSDGACS